MARSGERRALTPRATTRSASMSRPESVSSRIASFGSSTAIWRISLRFFSPPENPSLTRAVEELLVHLDELHLLLQRSQEVDRVELFELAAVLADRVERGLAGSTCSSRPGSRPDTGTRGTRPRARALRAPARAGPGRRSSTVPPVTSYAGWPASTLRERALARAVRPHDRVHLAALTVRSMPLQDLVVRRRERADS